MVCGGFSVENFDFGTLHGVQSRYAPQLREHGAKGLNLRLKAKRPNTETSARQQFTLTRPQPRQRQRIPCNCSGPHANSIRFDLLILTTYGIPKRDLYEPAESDTSISGAGAEVRCGRSRKKESVQTGARTRGRRSAFDGNFKRE